MSIHIKTESEIATMRQAGKKLAEVMSCLEKKNQAWRHNFAN